MPFAVVLVAELRAFNIFTAEQRRALRAFGKLIAGKPSGTRHADVGTFPTRPAMVNEGVYVVIAGRFLTDLTCVSVVTAV